VNDLASLASVIHTARCERSEHILYTVRDAFDVRLGKACRWCDYIEPDPALLWWEENGLAQAGKMREQAFLNAEEADR
jgi:hypothetical protein